MASLASSLIGNMLQRDPKKRATLEQIEGHQWLQGVDPSPATKLSTPLVSHRSLSEEEHGSIIQRMVLGGIADRDAITEYVSLPLTFTQINGSYSFLCNLQKFVMAHWCY